MTMPLPNLPNHQYIAMYETRCDLNVEVLKSDKSSNNYEEKNAIEYASHLKSRIDDMLAQARAKSVIKKIKIMTGNIPVEFKPVKMKEVHERARKIIDSKVRYIAYYVRDDKPQEMDLGRWTFVIYKEKIEYFVVAEDGKVYGGQMGFKRPTNEEPLFTKIEHVESYRVPLIQRNIKMPDQDIETLRNEMKFEEPNLNSSIKVKEDNNLSQTEIIPIEKELKIDDGSDETERDKDSNVKDTSSSKTQGNDRRLSQTYTQDGDKEIELSTASRSDSIHISQSTRL